MAGKHLFSYSGSNYNGQLSKFCNYEELFGSDQHTVLDAIRELVVRNVSVKNIIKYYKENDIKDTRIRYDKSSRLWVVELLFSQDGDEELRHWIDLSALGQCLDAVVLNVEADA